MTASKTSTRRSRAPGQNRSAETEGGAKKKKRSPLRKVTAKKVKVPRDVPIGPRQIRHLRALGHPLKAVVQVGKAGVTPALVASAIAQLAAHELVKVKVSEEDRELRREQAELLAKETGAVLAEVLGRTLLLYKRHPKTPRIVLPSGSAATAKPSDTDGESDAPDDIDIDSDIIDDDF